jgi:glycosyltransferase involved in cell wall biosynthesis
MGGEGRGVRPVRVAFLASHVYPLLAGRGDFPVIGGAEVQQHLLARELRAFGLEIRLVVEDLGQGPECTADGFVLHGYRFGRDKVAQARSLWRALRTADPDVIYVRNVPRFITVLLAFRWRYRRPLVLGLSTNYHVYPRSVTGQNLLDYLAYRLALREADAVVAQSEFQARGLDRHFRRRDARVIRNGAVATPAPPDDALRDRVAWIATLHPYKGIERLFDLARRLPGLQFEVVGGPARGQDGYYRAMEAVARGIPNLSWRGFVQHDRIDEILARSFALVNTTTSFQGVPNVEGFPNVYLEAWRNAVPVLTLDNDPDGLIEAKGLGFHCPTPAAMAADLTRLAADPALRGRIGRAARRHFEEEHDIRDIARRYAKLFEELARGARSMGAR